MCQLNIALMLQKHMHLCRYARSLRKKQILPKNYRVVMTRKKVFKKCSTWFRPKFLFSTVHQVQETSQAEPKTFTFSARRSRVATTARPQKECVLAYTFVADFALCKASRCLFKKKVKE